MGGRALLAVALLVVAGCGSEGEGSEDAAPSSDGTTQAPATTSVPMGTTDGEPSSTGGATTASADGTTGSSESGTTGSMGTPGCGMPAGLVDGEHSFSLDGYDRRYILRLPETYDAAQPWPLILALHGNGGDPGYWDTVGGERDIRSAFATEAILVIPEAIDNQWRDYSADPATWPERIELELSYFDAIYDELQAALCIHPDQVFSMGFSGGGSFSGVLGCRRDYIRAIAVGGSVIYFEPEECVFSPAAWITIGEGEYNDGRAAFLELFRVQGGCAETSTAGDPEGCIDYEGCGPETPVTYCTHPGRHVWPSIGVAATRAFFRRFYQAG